MERTSTLPINWKSLVTSCHITKYTFYNPILIYSCYTSLSLATNPAYLGSFIANTLAIDCYFFEYGCIA
jgi:hypothetical protein